MTLWNQIKNLLARASEHETPPEKFTKLEPRGKVLSSWGGVLKVTPFARHFLRIDNTNYNELFSHNERQLLGLKPGSTSEIFIGFQYLRKPSTVQFLYSEQKDFRVPGLSSKFVAAEVGDRVAQKMMAEPIPSKLLGGDNEYWNEEVMIAHSSILYRALKDMGISRAAFDLEPEMYKRKFGKN